MVAYCDEREGIQDEDQNDFAARKPEFRLTVRLDSQNVAKCVQRDDSSDDSRSWDIISPVPKHNVERSHLERDQQSFVEEEVPAGHEACSDVST